MKALILATRARNWSWERDDFDEKGKLILLYRHQRFLDEGYIGKFVLDIGGWGKMAFRLAQEGCEVVLLDLTLNGHHNFNKFESICADAHFLPFQNESFNTVHSSETLEHVKSAEQVCEEVFRVLKTGGIYCGTVPIPNMTHKLGEEGIRFFSQSELKELLSEYWIKRIEPTPSIKPVGELCCSIMFVAEKVGGT